MSLLFDETGFVPLIIYRVCPEDACYLGVLAQTVSDIGQLAQYKELPGAYPDSASSLYPLCGKAPQNTETEQSPAEGRRNALPPLKFRPIAALTNAEGLERSREEHCLWLWHPQLNELRPYRGKPPLLALQQSYSFYEAYLPLSSSALPYEWFSAEQLNRLHSETFRAGGPEQDSVLSGPWLDSEERQSFLGTLAKHFFFWQKLGRSLLRAKVHARLPQKLKEREQWLEQTYQTDGPEGPCADGPAEYRIPLQAKYPNKYQDKQPNKSKEPQKQGSPLQAWLAEGQEALGQLQESLNEGRQTANGRTANKGLQSEYLARILWAVTAFWAGSRLRPETVLRKLTDWLHLEQYHQTLETKHSEHRIRSEAPVVKSEAIEPEAIEPEAVEPEAAEPEKAPLYRATPERREEMHPELQAWQALLRQQRPGREQDKKGHADRKQQSGPEN
ncbi:hypothetical protein P0082_08215 [Candidatus Haliotispira prima]|uniref:Uncharacterized protein n=1 Tax=Candidatus Haliotispira prima TaxID=3034016 RepID=A0ABY8MES7_9SPIO|nr:hypothetical protein P0082_08215 [Candidatus Haliotispira prima]